MKKQVTMMISLIAIIGIVLGSYMFVKKVKEENEDKTTVSYNGWLKVDGSSLKNQKNEEVQLRGISTHGIQWFGELYTKENLTTLKNDFKINVFRIAMYTNPDDNGFVKNATLKDQVEQIVEWSKELDIYVVIDWHILNDNNPMTYKTEAINFFKEMSEKYKDYPNVIYEICNEPNGEVEWEKDVKPYAEEVISAIRINAPKSVIIVGSPDWSRDLLSISKSPLQGENIMYSVHFYSGSDNKTLRDRMDSFREKNLAIFVSECGMTDSTGDGKVYEEAFGRWVDYMNEKKISWIYWSLANKAEASAMLKSEYDPKKEIPEGEDKNSNNINNFLSESGEAVKRFLTAGKQ